MKSERKKIKIILTVGIILAGGMLFSSKTFAACSSGECRTTCQDTEKPSGEKCTFSAGDYSQEGDCCVQKSGIDLTSGKVCSEENGMVAGRCYVGGITGCMGVGPGLALAEKGQLGCPSDQICCKTQQYQDATQGKPETTSNTPSSPASTSANPMSSNSGSISGLVPCRDNCTLCHLILGFKNIFDFLLGLLFIATMLVITVAGVFYMVSTGSKGMIDKAKKALTLGLTAFVIGMGSWLFVNIVMQMVGFKHPMGGNWWQFTCDTAQTQGPAVTSPGPTLASGAATAGTGAANRTPMPTDGSQISNALQKYADVVYDKTNWDCSRYVQAVAKAGTGWDPGGNTLEMMKGAIPFDQSQLVNGTVLVSNNSDGGRHAAYFYDGNIYNLANKGESPKVWNYDGYMAYANKNGNFVMRLPGT